MIELRGKSVRTAFCHAMQSGTLVQGLLRRARCDTKFLGEAAPEPRWATHRLISAIVSLLCRPLQTLNYYEFSPLLTVFLQIRPPIHSFVGFLISTKLITVSG